MTTTQTTATQAKAALAAALAVAEAIRELKEIPSGHLYAVLMGKFSFQDYQAMIAILVNAGLVAQDDSHLLRWVGPEVAA